MYKIHDHNQESMTPNLYAASYSLRIHPVVKELAEVTRNHRLNIMMGSLDEMQLLQNLARAIGAKKTLDIGVFTGVSSLSIALVLPEGGKVHALDLNREYVEIGIPFWKKAGVEDKIEFTEGPALETLDKFIANGESGTFDFAFIDADKLNYDNYYERCLVLVRSGGIIAVDNTLWSGLVYDKTVNDESTVAIRALNEKLRGDERVYISFLTIGDGTTLLFKK